jgi:DNA-binding HxlR family transcriptional regulator
MEKDFDLICNFLVRVTSRIQSLIDNMKLSKNPSKAYLKCTKGKGLTTLYLLFRTDFTKVGSRSPNDINELMDKNVRKHTTNEEFISSKILSEVLKVLENAGLFKNIKSKKKIKELIGYRNPKLKGRPSLYVIPIKVIDINTFLSRHKIRRVIIKHLSRTKLLHQFIYYVVYGFYRFVREASDKQLYEGFRSVADIDSKEADDLVQKYTEVKSVLLSSDEKLLVKLAKASTNEFLKNMTKNKSDLLKRILLLLYNLKSD